MIDAAFWYSPGTIPAGGCVSSATISLPFIYVTELQLDTARTISKRNSELSFFMSSLVFTAYGKK